MWVFFFYFYRYSFIWELTNLHEWHKQTNKLLEIKSQFVIQTHLFRKAEQFALVERDPAGTSSGCSHIIVSAPSFLQFYQGWMCHLSASWPWWCACYNPLIDIVNDQRSAYKHTKLLIYLLICLRAREWLEDSHIQWQRYTVSLIFSHVDVQHYTARSAQTSLRAELLQICDIIRNKVELFYWEECIPY